MRETLIASALLDLLPEDARAVLHREAVRRRRPVIDVITQELTEITARINSDSYSTPSQKEAPVKTAIAS